METIMNDSFPSSGQHADEPIVESPADEIVEKADNLDGNFPEPPNEIVWGSLEDNHGADTIGDMHDNPASAYSDVGVAVADATNATRIASSVTSTEPIRRKRWYEKTYVLITISTLLQIGLGMVLLTLLWRLDYRPLRIVIIAAVTVSAILTLIYMCEFEWQWAGSTWLFCVTTYNSRGILGFTLGCFLLRRALDLVTGLKVCN